MALPPIPAPDPSLRGRLLRLGVTPEFVREAAVPPDTLFSPLRLSRAASLNPDPAYAALRETFCRPDFHVRWVRHLLLFSDYLRDDAEPLAAMGAGQTTAILFKAAAAHIGSASRVLDLGCGAGTLALLLAGSVDHVVAADINPRAVELTFFNAVQNGVANVDARCGDLFEPVAGERFDLIVSQPPYYPGAEGPVFLQGGGSDGTEIGMRLLHGLAPHLTPEGRAVVHTSLPLQAPTPELPGLRTVEYTPGAGEVEGTRHSVLVLTYGSGAVRLDVDTARWGRWPI